MSHALLSPSAAHRWMTCTPSARLEERFPDTAGEAAAEGTLAHRLCETLLNRKLKRLGKKAFDGEIANIEADELYAPDMQEHAKEYVEIVMNTRDHAIERKEQPEIYVERQIDISDYAPECYGTCDVLIVTDGKFAVMDYKYGKGVRVKAEDNRQMMLYALGALLDVNPVRQIDAIVMSIFQPRCGGLSNWHVSPHELLDWAETELKPRAALAFKGEGEYVPGDHCRFCRARAQCRALANHNMQLARHEFADPALLGDAEVSDILTRAKLFTNWIGAVEDYALREAAENGKRWPGYKLVEGRSNRIYSDEQAVAERLRGAGYADDAIYKPPSLTGITEMQRKLSQKVFDRLLGDLIVKPAGKPTLVPDTDKRPELHGNEAARKDFEQITTDY